MPKRGMEAQRREALLAAATREVAAAGTSDVTVARIARQAGMSPALAHHYFGSKERILVAAMRRVLRAFGDEARAGLRAAEGPRARLEAIVRASFAPVNFEGETSAAWLAFYVAAQRDEGSRRLLHIYQARLRSNLIAALRPLTGDPEAGAALLAALIDGLYLRAALSDGPADGAAAAASVLAAADAMLG